MYPSGSARRRVVRVGSARRGVAALVAVVVLAAASYLAWYVLHGPGRQSPGCVATAVAAGDGSPTAFPLTREQADNAATIAGVGMKLGMPDRAVTVALVTALQESRLVNLPGGDRDSAGLFQQRPSQGWGSYAQVVDPVHAATAFYQRLRAQPGWAELSVNDAAQLVQQSAAPYAYAQWEPAARADAAALTGETPGGLSCHALTLDGPHADVASTAAAELGTTTLSGSHPTARGWALSSWLVGHAARLGIDRVSFDGRTWTAASGSWSSGGPADGVLSLHQASGAG